MKLLDSLTPPPGGFGCIMADPPWAYSAPGQFGCTLEHRPNRDTTLNCLGAGSRARYGAMTMEQLKSLRVQDVAADNAHLYLWTTNSFMVEAHDLARAWGFKPATIITWTKIRQADGKPSMKMGYYYRGATEHIVFCVRGKLRLHGPARPTALLLPRLPHSQKPDEAFALCEEQSPGPYLEIFSRNRRPGWTPWGDDPSLSITD